MKKRFLAALVCICMLAGMTVPAYAADPTFSVTLSETTLSVSDVDQTVEMTLSGSEAFELLAFQFNYDLPAGWSVAVSTTTDTKSFTTMPNTDELYFQADAAANVLVTDLAVITYTIPAGTSGTYTVGINNLLAYNEQYYTWADGFTAATATITIEEDSADGGDDETATGVTIKSGTVGTVRVGDTITVNIGAAETFAATEMTITYDASLVSFVEPAQGDALYGKVTNSAGTIKLADYGADKAASDANYVLTFTAIADGEAAFQITEAAFGTGTSAVDKNLTPVTELPDALSILIKLQPHTVTLPSGFTGNEEVEDGADYTFELSDKTELKKYVYTVTATQGGVNKPVTDNGDGTYTISNVTGDLVITYTTTNRSYTVNWSGTGAADVISKPTTATYGTDFVFELPADKAADETAGYAYTLEVTVDGQTYNPTKNGQTYTIAGSAILGNIQITVTKTTTAANQFKVEVQGEDVTVDGASSVVVNKGDDVTLKLTPEAGYKYVVEVNGSEVELDENNEYIISDVDSVITVTVTKTVDASSILVKEYLTLNATKMWLVYTETTLKSGKTWTYGGNNMYWSDKYNAYCYLVVAPTLDAATAQTAAGIANGTATAIAYDKDVNQTGFVDANDAQLAYNMYQAKAYTDFSVVSMDKFLEADVNWDKTVNTADAADIIAAVLARTSN